MRSRPSRIIFSTLMWVCEALGCSIGKLTAGMDAPGLGGSTEPPLIPPETVAVLDQLAQIRSPSVRRAVLEFVRALTWD